MEGTWNKNGWMVDGHSPDETKDFKKFISKDELAGVAIKPDGDITCVFKSEQSQVRGAIQDLIITARENGGVKMDCYGIGIVKMYEKCGFEPIAKVRFDPQFAPPDFPKDPNYNPPDFIYFLKKTNKSTAKVIKDIKNNTYPQSDKTRLESLPEFDYEEAGKYRDSLL